MGIDLGQFVHIFLEEANEHLTTMESGLLGIELGAPDPESLNAIFRAAHSIKGGAGTFGFGDMAEFTHTLETLLDHVRRGELALDDEGLDACLRAVDTLRAMLARHQGGADGEPGDTGALTAELAALIAPSQIPAAAPAGPRAGSLAAVSAADADTDSDAFGFFDPLPDAGGDAADEGYGFFEPLPGASAPAADAGYGFFEPLADAGDTAADEAYGFFEPLPGPAGENDRYGFFAPLGAAPAGEAAAMPVAAPGFAGCGVSDAAPGIPATPATDEAYGLFAAAAGAPANAAPRRAGGTTADRPGADKPAAAAGDASSIRVGIDKVDRLINLVGELVITQSMLLQSAAALEPIAHQRLLDGLAQLERNSRDLQESVMSIRMVPMSVVFSRYPRLVRDLAKKLGKTVELQLVGESTELDKGLIEKIVDPLTHLVRNAVDHGLEPPEVRRAAGKAATGQITLSAAHQSGHILIEIADDGAGLNRERILAKAARQGLPLTAEASDAEVWDLIFAPGFSTAEAVTDISGRGVGMDVVRKNIQALGGSVQLWSATGEGTRVSIRLPLTLAILDGMSVRTGDETFIVPLDFVVESLHGAGLEFRSIGRDGRVVRVREDYLPVVGLAGLLDIAAPSQPVERAVLVVLEADGRRIALAVDALLGQHQVVVKNLETHYRRVHGISGATILGDGRVSLILDVSGLIRMTQPEGMSAAA